MLRRLVSVLAGVLAAAALALPATAGNPLGGLELLKDYEARRSSSSDPDWHNGNADARPIEPGETLVIADLEGPGRIVHIWNTVAAQDRWYSRLLVLRMYWDGEKEPSVEVPLGDFFAAGHGMDVPVNSLPVRVTSEGRARNCYWPMPFRKSARITVTNEGKGRVNAFYYYVDWQKLKSLPKDTAYFHAQYRQQVPCQPGGKNYVILEAEGRGHYVGTVQSVRLNEPGWYGEGDDFFFIDGEQEPRCAARERRTTSATPGGSASSTGFTTACPSGRATTPATAARSIAGTSRIPSRSASPCGWRSSTKAPATT